jgi:hypothetical protein
VCVAGIIRKGNFLNGVLWKVMLRTENKFAILPTNFL